MEQYRAIVGQASSYQYEPGDGTTPTGNYRYALLRMQAEDTVPTLLLGQEASNYLYCARVFQCDPVSGTVIQLHYNNPSFGYGGYCLPKDTKQLLTDYGGRPNDLIAAVVASNDTRKRYIAEQALQKAMSCAAENGRTSCTVGIYQLIMKTGSDNFRQSAIQDIIKMLTKRKAAVVIYEPALSADSFMGCRVIHDFSAYTDSCDLILVNRRTAELHSHGAKIYTRDLFYVD